MNGPQEVGQQYVAAQPPLPPPAPVYGDPAAGQPPTWQSRPPRTYADDPRRKSPALAAILSLMPGLGQVYVGYYHQGFAHMAIIATIFLLLASRVAHVLGPAIGFFLAFFWLYNVIDAYRRALFYNHALAGLTSVELPPEIKLPKGQGSLVGGVALVGFGSLFLANTAFGVSLDWLEDWWPAAFVLMGFYLIYTHVAANKSAEARPANDEPRA